MVLFGYIKIHGMLGTARYGTMDGVIVLDFIFFAIGWSSDR
jgi:hypothetical protein